MNGLHNLAPEEWLARWRRAMATVEDVEILRVLRADFEAHARPLLSPSQVEEAVEMHNAALARLGKGNMVS